MATVSAVFGISPTEGVSASLATTVASSAILIGKRRLIRVWASKDTAVVNDAVLNIAIGPSTMAAPSITSFAIGIVPQDIDMGSEYDYIRFYNPMAAAVTYHYQVLNRS